MSEHTFQNDGTGHCRVCGRESTVPFAVTQDDGQTVTYTVATHPLIAPGAPGGES